MKIDFQLEKQKKPKSQKGMKVVYGGVKRTGYRIRWLLLLALIALPVLAVVYTLVKPSVFTIAQAVVSYNPVNIKASRQSVVSELHAESGDIVSTGQVLLVLKDTVLDSEIEFLLSEIISLKKYDEQRDRGRLALYETAKRQAENHVIEMKAIKEQFEGYNSEGLVGTSDYASVLDNYSAAIKQYSDSKIQLKLAKMQLSDEDYSGEIRNIIRSLEKELELKRSQKRALTIRSPFDAVVLSVIARAGESIDEGSEVIVLAPHIQRPEVIAYLDAKHVLLAQLGTTAKVQLPSGDWIEAYVSKPTQLASKLPIQLTKPFEGQRALLQVTLSFETDAIDNPLIEGMPVEVYF